MALKDELCEWQARRSGARLQSAIVKRRIFNAIAVVSAVLFGVTLGLLIKSYPGLDGGQARIGRQLLALSSANGALSASWDTNYPGATRTKWQSRSEERRVGKEGGR